MILLTGYTGFIGRKIYNHLQNENLEFMLCGRQNIYKNQFTYMDLYNFIPSINSFVGVESVIHFASILPNDIEKDYSEILKNELLFIENCYKSGVKRFIFASSGAIYGENGRFSELDKPNPQSNYGKYKLKIEKKICEYWPNDHLILRYFFPYGKEQNVPRLIPKIVENLKSDRDIYIRGEKGILFNPIYIDDVILFTKELIRGEYTGIFNISGYEEIYLEDLIIRIANKLNIEAKIIKLGSSEKQELIGHNKKINLIIKNLKHSNIEQSLSKIFDY